MINRRSPYPKFFKTPEGRAVSIATMRKALRAIKINPEADYPGWNWCATRGQLIINEFRRGLHDRINQRGEAATKYTHEALMTLSRPDLEALALDRCKASETYELRCSIESIPSRALAKIILKGIH